MGYSEWKTIRCLSPATPLLPQYLKMIIFQIIINQLMLFEKSEYLGDWGFDSLSDFSYFHSIANLSWCMSLFKRILLWNCSITNRDWIVSEYIPIKNWEIVYAMIPIMSRTSILLLVLVLYSSMALISRCPMITLITVKVRGINWSKI